VSVDAKTRTRIDGFLRKLFVKGNYCKELFHKLCKDGCCADDLGGLLFAVCTITRGYSDGLICLGEPSAKEIKQLVRDLGALANLVARVNRSPLNPKFGLLALPTDLNKDPARKHVARLYDMLPGLMRAYSFHLQQFAKFNRALLKRLTHAHFETLRLLLYIEESTGSPHYEDVSNLLTAGYLAAGGAANDVPKFFTADALAKLKQRTKHFGINSRFGRRTNPPAR
jgi:hypothetical protein